MKKLSLFTILFLIFFFILIKNYKFLSDSVPEGIKKKIPLSIVNIHLEIENYINLFSNKNYLYNVKFIPDTILVNDNGRIELELNEITLNDKDFEKSKFFIDLYEEYVIFSTGNSNLFYILKEKINQNIKAITPVKLKSNLDLYSNLKIMDSFIDGNNFYISTFVKKSKFENCDFRILRAKINFNKLIFDELFINPGCTNEFILGGRMQKFSVDNAKGIIFSLAEQSSDQIHFKAQDDSSYVGKIIFLDTEKKISMIYSKGHRVPQGLYVKDNLILSTEHGPMGGDEINKIIKDGNYGWPIASYGKYYFSKNKSYLYNHQINGFIEPIYSYFTAIGISEIVKVPQKFFKIKDLTNIFFISSLAGKSLHLVKFDNNYDRVIFTEKIFINKEIRDLKYLNEKNLFLLSLQVPSKLGIFKIK